MLSQLDLVWSGWGVNVFELSKDFVLVVSKLEWFLCLLERILERCFSLKPLVFYLLLFFVLGWLTEEGQLSSLPVDDHLFREIVNIRFSSFQKFSCLPGELLEEVFGIKPIWNTVNVINMLLFNPIKDWLHKLCRVWEFLNSDDTLENFLSLGLALVMDDSWAIDQVDSLGHSKILPTPRLSWNWSCFAACLLHECVDDRWLSSVWVANQTDTDVLLVSVEKVELLQELDEWALTERVLDTCLEGQGWIRFWKVLDPLLNYRSRNQIAFVQDEDEMLVWAFVLQIELDEPSPRTVGVSCIQNIKQNIRTINNLVKFFPNSLWLTFRKNGVLNFRFCIDHIPSVEILILLIIVII